MGKGEYGWIWCGGNGDGSRMVEASEDEAGVEGCVSLRENMIRARVLRD